MTPELADFAGSWLLDRRIRDHRGGREGRFLGRAAFVPAGAALAYHEEGLLTLEGQAPLQAERRYLWRAEGGRIIVDHGDGRPFHGFDPAAPEARHLCAPDDYAVRYDFARWPLWTAEWTVRGPRKDYTLLSAYVPLAVAG